MRTHSKLKGKKRKEKARRGRNLGPKQGNETLRSMAVQFSLGLASLVSVSMYIYNPNFWVFHIQILTWLLSECNAEEDAKKSYVRPFVQSNNT